MTLKFPKKKRVDAVIKDSSDRVYFECRNVLAPEAWSQTAIDIAASKYFRRSVKKENSIFQLVDRLLLGIQSAYKFSLPGYTNRRIQDEIEFLRLLLLNQVAAFNSPVWFNCGLSEAYGLSSLSHHYAFDFKKKKIIAITDAYLRPQVSACFIQSVADQLESIFDLVKNEAKLFKYGSGSGSNFSLLRSKYENLNSGGKSSGLISFLEVLDKSAGAIKSGGTTRRAAKMVCVDVDHPEIMDFIRWKLNEERKAKALIQMGYSSDLDGEAYHTVSGQNANNSVRLTDQFMKAVESNKMWTLKSRTRPQRAIKKIPAQEVWQQLCAAAWECADPGVQFSDTINRFHTCAQTDSIYASNPCSEYMFLNDSACNLASINLVRFLSEDHNSKSVFDFELYLKTIRHLITAQESLVDYASYPTEKIAQNSHDYRPLGLGFANLGSLFMQMGISYDSDEARAWAGLLAALLTGEAYRQSTVLAEQQGCFPGFKNNRASMLKVIRRHQRSLGKIKWNLLPPGLKELCFQIWNDVIQRGEKYGFRNAQVTAIAPTGTIGLVMDCDTTGIEPEFSLIKIKKLSGGGQLRTVNQAVEKVLKMWGFSEKQILLIKNEIENSGTLQNCQLLNEKQRKVFLTAQGQNKSGNDCLSADAHLLMMAAVQPFISGAISKTINMPSEATTTDISEVYFKAWTLGLKAVAIYRDGSKFVQPLQSGVSKNSVSLGFPQCTECGGVTILESGCYRCLNCGTTTACAG